MIVRHGGWKQDFEGHGIEPDQDAARVLRLNVEAQVYGLGDSAAILLQTIHDRKAAILGLLSS